MREPRSPLVLGGRLLNNYAVILPTNPTPTRPDVGPRGLWRGLRIASSIAVSRAVGDGTRWRRSRSARIADTERCFNCVAYGGAGRPKSLVRPRPRPHAECPRRPAPAAAPARTDRPGRAYGRAADVAERAHHKRDREPERGRRAGVSEPSFPGRLERDSILPAAPNENAVPGSRRRLAFRRPRTSTGGVPSAGCTVTGRDLHTQVLRP